MARGRRSVSAIGFSTGSGRKGGVHNATSGYRRGLGKNGGGLPGQPSGKKKGVNRKKLALGFAAAGLAAGGAYVAYKSKGGSPRGSASNLGRIASEKLNAKNAAFARTPSRGARTDYVRFFGVSPDRSGEGSLNYSPRGYRAPGNAARKYSRMEMRLNSELGYARSRYAESPQSFNRRRKRGGRSSNSRRQYRDLGY